MTRPFEGESRNTLASAQQVLLSRLQCFVLLLVMVTPGLADQWGPPAPEHRSGNGNFALKVSGGQGAEARLELWGLGEREPRWSRSCAELGGPPHKAYVAGDGQSVVLRDVHGRLGHGKCLVFLGPQGEIRQAYELGDLLTEHEAAFTETTMSSKRWSDPGWFSLRDDDRQFAFVSSKGSLRCFDTESRGALVIDSELRSRIVEEASAHGQQLLSSSDVWRRKKGASLLGLLGTTANADTLSALLDEAAVAKPGGIWPNRWVTDEIRAIVAIALVRLVGQEAMPWVEPILDTPFSSSRTRLLRALTDQREEDFFPGLRRSPITSTTWERLAQNRSPEVRRSALGELLDDGEGTYLRGHLELLDSPDEVVRGMARRTLAGCGTVEDVPRLRAFLREGNDRDKIHVWRALVRLDVEKVEEHLDWASRRESRQIRFEAWVETARRGNSRAKSEVLCRILELQVCEPGRAAFQSMIETEVLCQLVVEKGWHAAESGLRAALSCEFKDIRRPAAGALAALGDRHALKLLRGFAREGHSWERASAIRWLGRAGDADSLQLLENSLDDEEPVIREAATEAIELLGTDSK